MWKRDEAVRTTSDTESASSHGKATDGSVASQRPGTDQKRASERSVVNIGKSVVIKGELNGSEDLTVEGHVEGKIELRQHALTVGPNGKIKAQVFAKSVIVLGAVTGNITAAESVALRDSGSVDGDIAAPRVAIAEGAHFRGSIDMRAAGSAPRSVEAKAESKLTQPASGAAMPGALR
jgi:cytoskeletal protein CcmA (bactofilin family)